MQYIRQTCNIIVGGMTTRRLQDMVLDWNTIIYNYQYNF